ncbi:MAG: O-antigen ligase family protein, partial [Chloroflexota bacterium]
MKATAAPKSPLLMAAIQLGLLVLAIYYTFIGGQTALGIYDHRWRLITLWFTAVIIGLWLLWRWFGRVKIPRTPLDYPLLFLLLAWLLATAFSVNRTYSLESLVFFVVYLFFYYVAVDLGRRPWLVELTFNAMIGVAGLVWTLALWQLSRWYQDLPAVPALLQPLAESFQTLPRLSVLGNPNTMASFLALVLPVVLYKFSSSRRLMSRLLLGLWLVMLTASILLTQSRGGALALMVAVAFLAAGWAAQKTGITPGNLRIDPRLRAGVWLLAGALVLLFGLFGWLIFSQRSLSEGVDVRQQVITGAFKSLSRYPLLGAGPGTLGEEIIRYQRPLAVIWGDAHNLPLTLMAETGLIGGIGLVWLAVVGLKLLGTTLWQFDRAQQRLSSLACVAALLGFAAHNLVDSLFKFPLIMLLVATWAGFWVSVYVPAPEDSRTGQGWGRRLMAAAAILLAGNTLIGVHGLRNIAAYNQAVEAAARADWPAAYDHLARAVQLAPTVPFYHRQSGLVAGYRAEQDSTYRQAAISHYQTALAGLDQLAIDHANLGSLLWADGRQAEAIQALERAVELEPGNAISRLNLGHYHEAAGQAVEASAAYA